MYRQFSSNPQSDSRAIPKRCQSIPKRVPSAAQEIHKRFRRGSKEIRKQFPSARCRSDVTRFPSDFQANPTRTPHNAGWGAWGGGGRQDPRAHFKLALVAILYINVSYDVRPAWRACPRPLGYGCCRL